MKRISVLVRIPQIEFLGQPIHPSVSGIVIFDGALHSTLFGVTVGQQKYEIQDQD